MTKFCRCVGSIKRSDESYMKKPTNRLAPASLLPTSRSSGQKQGENTHNQVATRTFQELREALKVTREIVTPSRVRWTINSSKREPR